MPEVTYNNNETVTSSTQSENSSGSPQNPQQPPPTQQVPGAQHSQGVAQPHVDRTMALVGLIVLIILLILTSLYLVFGRSATQPIPREEIEKSLPQSGALPQ